MLWLLRLIGFYQPVRILRQPNQSRLFEGGGYSLRLCLTEIATASAFAPELVSLKTARHHHPSLMMRRRQRLALHL